MTNRWLLRAPFVLLVPLAAASCTSLLGDFSSTGGADASSPDGTSPEASSYVDAGDLGKACATPSDCGGGPCSDGVCCDTACDGVCEACNLPGTMGTCSPIPANTDPQMECLGTSAPPPDAGVTVADASGTSDAAVSDAALGDAALGDAAPFDAGVVLSDAALGEDGAASDASVDAGFALPDGGVTIVQNGCAGSCNGARACAFPGATKACGSQFCANASSLARFACDGTGSCGLQTSSCGSYACEAQPDAGTDVVGACAATCSQTSDCNSATSYCDGQHCQPQLGLGISCSNPNECQSGNCVDTVCCSSACDFTGATCTKSGNVGKCQCELDCGDGGSCTLFYRDADGDGYGNALGTVANSGAIVGCMGAPPAGYVVDNTDCDDNDANVHPGQTSYFATPSHGTGTYDYNCDGVASPEYPVYLYQSCTYCGGTSPSCAGDQACTSTGQQASLSCASRLECLLSETPVVPGAITVDLAPIEPIQPIFHCYDICAGATAGFTTGGACGQTGTYTSCGTCSTTGSYSASGNTGTSMVQPCQ